MLYTLLMISIIIFDRQLCSKVLKEAFFVLVGVNQQAKYAPNGTKKCKGTKDLQREQAMFKWNRKCSYKILDKLKFSKVFLSAKCYLLWHIMALNCRVLPSVVFYGLMWPCIIFCGLVVRFVAMSGIVALWLYIAFPRGHRSKFIWSCSIYPLVLD